MPRHRRAPGRICALVSGGVDSAALVDRLLRSDYVVQPVYVRSGYRWEKAELHWLRRLLAAMSAPRLKPLVCLPFPAEAWSEPRFWARAGRKVPGARSRDEAVYLPGRNLALTCAAAGWCAIRGVSAIALGTLKTNPFHDATPAYFAALEDVLSRSFGRRVRIERPLRRQTKSEVVRGAAGVPWKLTFSCIAPAGLSPCGRCNKCEERRKSLAFARP